MAALGGEPSLPTQPVALTECVCKGETGLGFFTVPAMLLSGWGPCARTPHRMEGVAVGPAHHGAGAIAAVGTSLVLWKPE